MKMLQLVFIFFFFNYLIYTGTVVASSREIGIGVILDMESSVGNTSMACIKMALHDFYQNHNYTTTTKIIPHFRDSKYDRLEAASAAIQLIKDVQVMAIIGPQRSSQADFVVDIGNKAKVPILSLATTPFLSPKENPYFIRVSHPSSSQAQPIADLVKHFSWRYVVFLYQDDNGDFGTGLIPYLSEALLNVDAHIKHRIPISRFASDDAISNTLYDLKKNQTRVFVVHLLPDLASLFFKKAKQAGMMQEGYAWIITDVVTSLLHTLDNLDSMQGVVGVKPYIPTSVNLTNFEKRWKRTNRIDVFGLWSYDTTYALATAVERVGSATTFHRQKKKPAVTDLDAIGTSKLGSRLLSEIHKTNFKGLSGDFSLVDGQLQSSDYQIVNIVGREVKSIDLWTSGNGYKNSLNETIIWPGGSDQKPQGWEIPATKESKLKLGYPAKGGFPEFIDQQTNRAKPTGFCVEVFEAVMEALAVPYHPPPPPAYEYSPFTIEEKEASGSYDELVYQIFKEEYDVVIGDVTIRANRSKYVDFTLPYTESGVSMIVPIKKDDRKNPWIFMRPLEKQLWLTTCGFFIYTGVVVWVLEHRRRR